MFFYKCNAGHYDLNPKDYIPDFFCVGVMYSGEYDACDVTLSVYPHRASLKNMPDHGGNRTYDLWNTVGRALGYSIPKVVGSIPTIYLLGNPSCHHTPLSSTDSYRPNLCRTSSFLNLFNFSMGLYPYMEQLACPTT